MPEDIRNLKFEDNGWSGCLRDKDFHFKNCTTQYKDIVTFESLLTAWNDFISKKRKRSDINEYALHLSDNLFDLLNELKNSSYIHGEYDQYIICDPKKRVIHKANVKDRIVHRLVYNTLYSYFDKRYIYDSYSCRVGKGTHKAQARFRSFVNIVSKNYTKPCFVLKFDIKKCFESINKETLKLILVRHIEDAILKDLVYSIIDSFPSGLPLGNLTSQLFINVYLHEFDIYVKHLIKCPYYLRYADDIIIVHHDKKELESMYLDLQSFLKEKLHLTSHKKIVSSIYVGIDILGLVFFPKYERLRRSTERKAKLRDIANSLE